MITAQILNHYFTEAEDKEENLKNLLAEFEKSGDYIEINNHVFNAGGYLTFESSDYDEDKDTEASESGQIFTDKDNLIYILPEEIKHHF